MPIASAIAIYFIIWWLVFFIVLATGNRDPDPDTVAAAGNERGAPSRANIWRRILITTVAAAVAFAVFYAVINSGLTLEDIPLPHAPGT